MHPTAHLIVANGRISDLMIEANQSRLANRVALAAMASQPSTASRLIHRVARSVRELGDTVRSHRTAAT